MLPPSPGAPTGEERSALPSQTPTLHDYSGEVDVQQAEEQFSELCRELSTTSPQARHQSFGYKQRDVEKAEDAPEEEPFDLKEYLSSSNDKHQEAGIAHKHVGVIWEDLQVDVFGGVGSKVCISVIVRLSNVLPPSFRSMSEPSDVCHLTSVANEVS